MGARQSKRSVDITTSPKKGDGEVAPIGEERIEKLGDADVKAVVTNGTAAHTDIEFADKDEESKESEEKPTADIKENGLPETSDGEKTPDKETPASGDQQTAKIEESAVEKTPENGEKVPETPDTKKQKEKKKKKWSLRSISFSKKDKSKPSKDKDKNGEVEEVNEEKAEEVSSPTEEAVKTETAKTPAEETATPVTNGGATKEELAEKIPEAIVEEKVVTPVDEPAAPTPVVEAPKDEPKPVAEAPAKVEEPVKEVPEEVKPVVEETPVVAPVAVEEVKEVRSEEVPPPLPSSNPPSQVTVFAESTKDNVLTPSEISVGDSEPEKTSPKEEATVVETTSVPPVESPQVPLEEPTSVPPVESAPVPSVESVPVDTPVTPVESSPVPVESAPAPVESPPAPVESPPAPLESPPKPVESSPALLESSPAPVESSPVLLESPSAPVVSEEVPAVIPSPVKSEAPEPVPTEQNEKIIVLDTVSTSDSSPLIVEALPKQPEESLRNTSLESSGIDSSSNSVVPTESETKEILKVDESKENGIIESEQVSLKTENEDSLTSVPSVPFVIEEKMPIVSSAGDVPNPLDSETSVPSEDSLQELKSNLNIKESPVSIESRSEDLSTIPEAASQEIKLAEDTSEVLPEPLSALPADLSSSPTELLASEQSLKNDSLPDLSTESLPSLPEPTDSVLEPMSLPPLDSVPEPLIDDNLPLSPAKIESSSPTPKATEPAVVLTNGSATNGLHKSADDDASPTSPPPLDGPLKQISASEPITGDVCENSQTTGDVPAKSVESVPAAVAE